MLVVSDAKCWAGQEVVVTLVIVEEARLNLGAKDICKEVVIHVLVCTSGNSYHS